MNYRTIIFSGIITALIGAMIGLAISHVAQKVERRKIIVIGGATVGFVLGAFQQAMVQQKKEEYEEENKK